MRRDVKPTVEVQNSEQLQMELGIALQECANRADKREVDKRQQKLIFGDLSEGNDE